VTQERGGEEATEQWQQTAGSPRLKVVAEERGTICGMIAGTKTRSATSIGTAPEQTADAAARRGIATRMTEGREDPNQGSTSRSGSTDVGATRVRSAPLMVDLG